MTDTRKAMQQALEALELHAKQYPHMQKGYTVDAIEALRSALAQQSPISDVTEAVTRTVIDVEKLLCEKLGKQWRPSGMSIQTLVDELAQQGEQQPVAWLDERGYTTAPLYAPAAQPEPDEAGHIGFQEWWDSVADEYEVNDFKKMRRAWNASLEYAPAAQPIMETYIKEDKTQPLTDEQIDALWFTDYPAGKKSYRVFARAIESHHGIGVQK